MIGSLGIVLVSFFTALYCFDLLDPDVARKRNAQTIIAALERYYKAKGTYPVLPLRDSQVSELGAVLISGGYISAIPSDTPGPEPTHYYSNDGKSFGLWLHFEALPPCKITIRDAGRDWWGDNMAYCKGVGSFGW